MHQDIQTNNIKIGIFFSIIILFATLLFSSLFKKINTDKETVFLLGRLSIWFCLFLIFLFANQIEKQRFLLWSEISMSNSQYLMSFLKIIGTIILGAITIGLTLKLLGSDAKQGIKFLEILKILKNNFVLLTFTCITAGVTEELIFRGYLMPRLQLFFNKNWVSIAISSILFGLMHIGYGTLMQLVGPLFIGIVFAIHYQKYRNIKILIFCHFFWDFMSLIMNTQLK
ncbi:MAG: CPBP family intramembrane metalloprotease [Flavobacterium sp.]|nr:CPBP family intramembrane metalloprotease [Flavobacterium sp.]